MSQTRRTIIFQSLAVIAVIAAVGTHLAHQPASIESFSDVGKEFYPNFEDPNQATGLRVAAYNPETGKTDVFSVERKDGLWVIPSHHNYPADAAERLAKTAASMVDVKRQALVERSADAHKRYDLLDPLDSETTGTEGRGDRITLYKGEEPLVDFIVGKKVEGTETVYNVRRADEDRFYRADLGNFDISTKFSDWIQKNVLDITRGDVRRLVVNRYYVDETRGTQVPEGQYELDRDSSSTPWTLEDLNPKTEQVKTAEVNNMLTALTDLKIIGVRAKPPNVAESLKAGGGIVADPITVREMVSRGFFLTQSGLVSNEGELHVGAANGVMYSLFFGEEFTGSEVDMEIGGAASQTDESTDAEAKTADDSAADEESDGEAADDESKSADGDSADEDNTEEIAKTNLVSGRYLFVLVHFDPSLLGEVPTAPVKPEPPSNSNPDAAAEGESEQADDGTQSDDPQSYQDALAKYQEEQEVYELKKKDYDDRKKAGEKTVKELNERFADWYYVISEDVFDRLKLKREAIVEPAPEPPAANDATTSPNSAAQPNPLDTPPEESATEETAMPADAETEEPGTEETAPEETPEAEPMAEEAAPDEATPEEPATEEGANVEASPEAEPMPDESASEQPETTEPATENESAGDEDSPTGEDSESESPETAPSPE